MIIVHQAIATKIELFQQFFNNKSALKKNYTNNQDNK